MDAKKTVAAAAVTVAAVTGVVTSTAFDSPLDLVPEVAEELNLDFEDSASVEDSRQNGPWAKVRQWVMSLPAAVRMLVVIGFSQIVCSTNLFQLALRLELIGYGIEVYRLLCQSQLIHHAIYQAMLLFVE